MNKYYKWKVLLIIAIVAFGIWKIVPPEEKITLGLDLQGGMHVVMKVDLEQVPETGREDATDRAVEVIRNRIDEFGVKEPSISKQGVDQIIIQLPGVTDRKRALEIIGKTAHLEFKRVAHQQELLDQALQGNVPEGYFLKELVEGDGLGSEKILLEKDTFLNGDTLVNAGVSFDQGSFGQPIVTLEFNEDGAKAFDEATAKASSDFRLDGIPRRIAILLDGTLRSAPQVRERIPSGKAIIQGNFDYDTASDLALVLRAGALPAPVYVEEERTVGPTLGKDSIESGIKASLIGLFLVLLAMLVYYRINGLVANVALVLNLLLLIAGLSLFNASLTLPGIAGIILAIGMAVDANVLIYERMREELDLGKSARAVISAGYNKALSTILDSNITTLITALLLFRFGTGPIRGFAITLSLGIIVSMFTALFVTRLIFDTLNRKKEIKMSMLKIVGVPKFDYFKLKHIAYGVSAVLIVGGLLFFYNRGADNFGVDFQGGTLVQVKFNQAMDTGQIRDALTAGGVEGSQIQDFGDPGMNEIIIRTPDIDTDGIEEVLINMVGKTDFSIERVETVGPAVGADLRSKALWASIWALLAMGVYVSFRFRFNFAVCAAIALLHDAAFTVGLYSISGREMNLTFIAAILTIIGYSLNDTIVIFDRIRENMKLLRKMSFSALVNLSLNQTLARTVITSGLTLLAVLALYFFGGEVINDFAFAILVGVVVGTYSSLFIAAPLAADFHGKKR